MDVDGLRWEVRSRGSGRPLLLIHGFTGRGTSWAGHATAFARRFRLIVVDLPGHGRSGTPADDPARISVERTADDLATILRRLGAAPAHVIGYSLGARIALRLAIAHPGCRRPARPREPVGRDRGSGGTRRPARPRTRPSPAGSSATGSRRSSTSGRRSRIFATQAALPPARAARIRAIRLANRPAGLAASLRGAGQGTMEPLGDRLAAVSARTLVIAGALDDVGRPRAEAVAAGIPGARLAVVDGSGHTPHDERPAAFRRLALDFLQEDAA